MKLWQIGYQNDTIPNPLLMYSEWLVLPSQRKNLFLPFLNFGHLALAKQLQNPLASSHLRSQKTVISFAFHSLPWEPPSVCEQNQAKHLDGEIYPNDALPSCQPAISTQPDISKGSLGPAALADLPAFHRCVREPAGISELRLCQQN